MTNDDSKKQVNLILVFIISEIKAWILIFQSFWFGEKRQVWDWTDTVRPETEDVI